MAVNKLSQVNSTDFSNAGISGASNLQENSVNSVFDPDDTGEVSGDKKQLTPEEKKNQLKGEAYMDLMKDVEDSAQGKPIVPALGDVLQSSIKKLQGILNSYIAKAVGLRMSLESLKKDSPEYKSKVQEVEKQIKQLKAQAQKELNNIYSVIHAAEEVSDILITKYGKDGAKTVPVDEIKALLVSMLESTGSVKPGDMKKKVEELLEKFKKSEDAKTQGDKGSSKLNDAPTLLGNVTQQNNSNKMSEPKQ